MEEVTQEQLEQTCREWQKRLRLQDWEITAKLRNWVDMSVFGRCGECQWNLQQKSATVDIVRPSQRCQDSDRMTKGGCWEQTLVHELLHLHFAPFHAQCDTLEQTAQEQAINGIASALVALKRQENIHLPEDYRRRLEAARGEGDQ